MSDLCVVFDIDDTLYLERDYVRSGFTAAGKWAEASLGLTGFAHRCMDAHESGLRGRVFDAALEDSGKAASPELIAALVAIYRSHVPDIRLLADAELTLDRLAGRWPVAVISDGPAISQSRKAEALGLAQYASPIVLTDVLGKDCSKPSPVAFRRVESAIPARRYVYVADNPLKDFHAPAALGWSTIRIRRAGGLHYAVDNAVVTPDYELADCTELSVLLSSLPRNGGAVA